MSFQAPLLLLLLLGIPLLALLVHASRERQKRYALRYPATPTLLAALEGAPSWQRLLAPILGALALVALVVAVARPQRRIAVPVQQASIVLITDHSGSMMATDVDPSRLQAAQKAANHFVDKLPGSVRVGEVAFADAPDAVQTPTTDHDAVRQIIDNQDAEGGTATGDAMQAALSLLQPPPGKKAPPSAIVMLSDGAKTEGSDPMLVAAEARRRHIPIYTVALGTPGATIPNPDPLGAPLPVAPDPELLRSISRETRGIAYSAQDEGRLNQIYDRLGSQLGSKTTHRQVTTWFAGLGLLLLVGAAAASVAYSGRLP